MAPGDRSGQIASPLRRGYEVRSPADDDGTGLEGGQPGIAVNAAEGMEAMLLACNRFPA